MHLINAKLLMQKQIQNLYTRKGYSAIQIARFLNDANPGNLHLTKTVSPFINNILFNQYLRRCSSFKNVKVIKHRNYITKKKALNYKYSYI